MNLEDFAAALQNQNLQAFLHVIRAGEGTSDADGYRRCFGGELFDAFTDHPRRLITKGRYTSTAAGAYQFLSRTWDGLVRQYGFADFSPAAQDLGAVALIAGTAVGAYFVQTAYASGPPDLVIAGLLPRKPAIGRSR